MGRTSAGLVRSVVTAWEAVGINQGNVVSVPNPKIGEGIPKDVVNVLILAFSNTIEEKICTSTVDLHECQLFL